MEKLKMPTIEQESPAQEIEEIAERIADLKLKMEGLIPHSHEWSVLHGKITHLENEIFGIEEKTWGMNPQHKKRKAA